MKVFLSTDMEGLAGVTHWDEVDPTKPDYGTWREVLRSHVEAACVGAVDAGATEMVVRDAHWAGRNLRPSDLPACARLLRGWSGHPLSMVEGLDSSFDAVAMLGYHAGGGMGGNPLAHTMSSKRIREIEVNGALASEFLLHGLAAATLEVPVVFVSGDATLCASVTALCPTITVVGVSEGKGAASLSGPAGSAEQQIRTGMARALRSPDRAKCVLPLAEHYDVRVRYGDHALAERTQHYPGARRVGPHEIALEATDWMEIMRALVFVL